MVDLQLHMKQYVWEQEEIVNEVPWFAAVEQLTPYVVQIWTPSGSGTGFLVSNSPQTFLCAIATAEHVIGHAYYWEEPIRIVHQASGKTVMLRSQNRLIETLQVDTAAIVFDSRELGLPATLLPLTPKDKFFKPGTEIGWLGYPAIPGASLCFFSGHISAWLEAEDAYLVDGVAINGVSGGPAFTIDGTLIGFVSNYFPNRATGEPLPGLAMVRGINRYHDLTERFRSIDDAKTQESRPTEPPLKISEGENSTKTNK